MLRLQNYFRALHVDLADAFGVRRVEIAAGFGRSIGGRRKFWTRSASMWTIYDESSPKPATNSKRIRE